MLLSEGDVVTLPKGLWVRKANGGAEQVIELGADVRGIVEDVWTAAIGSEDDHFMKCDLAAIRVFGLNDEYSKQNDRYVFATSGDYDRRFIVPSPQVDTQKYVRTYVKVG